MRILGGNGVQYLPEEFNSLPVSEVVHSGFEEGRVPLLVNDAMLSPGNLWSELNLVLIDGSHVFLRDFA